MTNPSVHFQLSFPAPQTHYVEVSMSIKNASEEAFIDLKMPVWTPGSYLIREYSKNVERFVAKASDGAPLKAVKQDKNTWRIFHDGQDVQVDYGVYAFEESVRTSLIDQDRAFLNPAGVFLYLDGKKNLSYTIEINLPDGWTKISTGLPRIAEKPIFHAEDVDILFDSPIEIGNQDTWQFEVDGVLHECAMVGIGDYDKNRLSEDITKIVQEENKIWGSNPNKYYVIITHNIEQGRGGLEHLNSTVLTSARLGYSEEASYKSYLSLVAHEYFHLWNVKRLRPKALGPFNYNQENYTTALWLMEGITAYYDNLIVRRCGFYDEQEYLQQLANDFNAVYNRPGHALQSAAQSSFDTWIKQYRPDENSHNVAISYYNKGAIHALMLDLQILIATQGKMRLDNVLRTAYEYFYLTEDRGFEIEELIEVAEKVTGVALRDIFESANSTIDLNYNKYLNAVGYELVDLRENHKHLALGMKIARQEGKIIIKSIDRDSGAWQGGLNVNDELLAINNYRIDENDKIIDYFNSKANEGEKISFLIARNGLIKNIEVAYLASTQKEYIIRRKDGASTQEKTLGTIWLSLES